MQTPIRTLGELVDVVQELIDSTGKHVYAEDLQAVLDRVHGQEEVCAIDHDTGLLVVTTEIGAPTVRLALRRGDTNEIVYVTYTRTAERDDDGRPIYR